MDRKTRAPVFVSAAGRVACGHKNTPSVRRRPGDKGTASAAAAGPHPEAHIPPRAALSRHAGASVRDGGGVFLGKYRARARASDDDDDGVAVVGLRSAFG